MIDASFNFQADAVSTVVYDSLPTVSSILRDRRLSVADGFKCGESLSLGGVTGVEPFAIGEHNKSVLQ